MKNNLQVKPMVLEIVNNQINDDEPPITKKTFERLKTEGFSEEDAKELIGEIVWAEVFVIMKEGKVFNLERFTAALNTLPELPWDNQ